MKEKADVEWELFDLTHIPKIKYPLIAQDDGWVYKYANLIWVNMYWNKKPRGNGNVSKIIGDEEIVNEGE